VLPPTDLLTFFAVLGRVDELTKNFSTSALSTATGDSEAEAVNAIANMIRAIKILNTTLRFR
jgi:hypothetical protein